MSKTVPSRSDPAAAGPSRAGMPSALPRAYQLGDRYGQDEGRVFMSGVQSLARLPLEQLRVDRRRGLKTAAFISGYQGSPLASYDREVAAVKKVADVEGLTFVHQPGLNEELAATAVMGSQVASTIDGFQFDGVLGLWYGKAPGLDRASDALRHAAFAGSSAHGGAIAIIGDDPAAKSSTLPSSSDATAVDLHMPLLYPGDVQEALDLGRHAVALSRGAGLWTALKIVAAVADGSGTVDLDPDRLQVLVPDYLVDGRQFAPRPNGRLLTPTTLDVEREFQEIRLEIAKTYGTLNGINRVTVDAPDAWIGIVACGYTYHELVEALDLVGLDTPAKVAGAGIRLIKLGMPIPLDVEFVRQFAQGLAEIFVVEEKNPTLEWLVKDALYAQAERPIVTGKRDPDGERLIPVTGTLDADAIVEPLRRRLLQRVSPERLIPAARRSGSRQLIPLSSNRVPFFCSGCPHNISTQVPDGALLGAGIGCHSMVLFMEPERVGELVGLTAMGNEGAQWIGMAPFLSRKHIFQNLGDGTFFHSGSLAIRAAVASGVDITYKLLYNGTVAMTGGQDAVGVKDVAAVSQMLLLEGVKRVLVTTDDVARYRRIRLPEGVEVWDRSRIIDAQTTLAALHGTTVLIHDQQCAAEKRRARKRDKLAAPAERVVINERVCEGCGDCGAKSNCLSVQPVETPFGRKTQIDQSSCNFDYSCLQGDCPSFMTVKPARRGKPGTAKAARTVAVLDRALPVPALIVPADDWSVRLSGIGGTGVVTVSQVLGTAAMLDGFEVRGLDQTGLSQKAGPVVSDLRFSRHGAPASNKATEGGVDLCLSFDLLVGSSDTHIVGADASRTVVVASTTRTATGPMVIHPETPYPALDGLQLRMDSVSRAGDNRYVDAGPLADAMFGDQTVTNLVVVGVAYQSGTIPVTFESIEEGIRLNGVAVDRNTAAFRLGRQWVIDSEAVERSIGLAGDALPAAFRPLVDRLADELVAYQSDRLATTFRSVVDRVGAGESALAPQSTALRDAVAENLFRLLAYKDEYEVARLLLAPEARAAAERVAGPGAKVVWQLHPPLLRALGMHNKIRVGRWAQPVLVGLRAMKRVRGTVFDPFGHTAIRRMERALPGEYIAAIDEVLGRLTAANLGQAVALARLPDQVRGYEGIKERRAADYRAELQAAVAAFR
jgi:indolepyruvate ferredoxin oxidoreductase